MPVALPHFVGLAGRIDEFCFAFGKGFLQLIPALDVHENVALPLVLMGLQQTLLICLIVIPLGLIGGLIFVRSTPFVMTRSDAATPTADLLPCRRPPVPRRRRKRPPPVRARPERNWS